MYGGHGGAGLLLLAAVAGYWVLERAETHKGSLRRAGRWIGWLIVISSFVGVACRVWFLAACQPGKGWCPFVGKHGGDPQHMMMESPQ